MRRGASRIPGHASVSDPRHEHNAPIPYSSRALCALLSLCVCCAAVLPVCGAFPQMRACVALIPKPLRGDFSDVGVWV